MLEPFGAPASSLNGSSASVVHVGRRRRRAPEKPAVVHVAARLQPVALELARPHRCQLAQLRRRRRQERELHAPGQGRRREFVAVDDDGPAVAPRVPRQLEFLDRRREHLALPRAQLAGQVTPAVEPHVAEAEPALQRLEERQRAADVVGIDVRHHEQLEHPLGCGYRFDALQQVLRRRLGSAIDQPPVRRAPVAVLDPQRVAMGGRKHLDVEERAGPGRRLAGRLGAGTRCRGRGEWSRRRAARCPSCRARARLPARCLRRGQARGRGPVGRRHRGEPPPAAPPVPSRRSSLSIRRRAVSTRPQSSQDTRRWASRFARSPTKRALPHQST